MSEGLRNSIREKNCKRCSKSFRYKSEKKLYCSDKCKWNQYLEKNPEARRRKLKYCPWNEHLFSLTRLGDKICSKCGLTLYYEDLMRLKTEPENRQKILISVSRRGGSRGA